MPLELEKRCHANTASGTKYRCTNWTWPCCALTGIANATDVAERLRDTVAATPFHVAGTDVSITVSVGAGSLATLSPEEEVGAQALLDQADRYVYRSKLAGRNRVSAPTAP